MIILIVILLATILLQLGFLGDFLDKFFIAPLSERFSNNFNAAFLLIILLLILFILAFVFYKYILPRLMHISLFQKLKHLYDGFVSGIKSIRKVKNVSLFMLYTVLIWGLYTLMVYLPLYSFRETSMLNFGDAITIMALGSIGFVAPIPGGIGSYHFIVINVMVKVFHIAEETSTSFAYLVHTSQTAMIIFVGALSYLMLFLTKRKSIAHANA